MALETAAATVKDDASEVAAEALARMAPGMDLLPDIHPAMDHLITRASDRFQYTAPRARLDLSRARHRL